MPRHAHNSVGGSLDKSASCMQAICRMSAPCRTTRSTNISIISRRQNRTACQAGSGPFSVGRQKVSAGPFLILPLTGIRQSRADRGRYSSDIAISQLRLVPVLFLAPTCCIYIHGPFLHMRSRYRMTIRLLSAMSSANSHGTSCGHRYGPASGQHGTGDL